MRRRDAPSRGAKPSTSPPVIVESIAVAVRMPSPALMSDSEAHTADEGAAANNDGPKKADSLRRDRGPAAANAPAPPPKKKIKDRRSAAAKRTGWAAPRRKRKAKPKGKPARASSAAASQVIVVAQEEEENVDELAAETAWAVQSMLDSDSDHEDGGRIVSSGLTAVQSMLASDSHHEDGAPQAPAAAASPAAAAPSPSPKKRQDRRSRAERDCGFSYKASPKRKKTQPPKGRPPKRRKAAPAGGDDTDGGGEDAIPAQPWSLGRSPDFGSPLLPQTGAGGTDHLPSGPEDDPHPLRCGAACKYTSTLHLLVISRYFLTYRACDYRRQHAPAAPARHRRWL